MNSTKHKVVAGALVVLFLSATAVLVVRNKIKSFEASFLAEADNGRIGGGASNPVPDWRGFLAKNPEERDKILKVWCVDNLKQIGGAAHEWSAKHGHRFPADLFALKEQISPRYLTCPEDSDRREVTKWFRAKAANVSYVIVSPNLNDPRPNVVVARCPIHGHVLLSDGTVFQGDYLKEQGMQLRKDNTLDRGAP